MFISISIIQKHRSYIGLPYSLSMPFLWIIVTGIFAPPLYRNQRENILAEVVFWPGVETPRVSDIYYFVIKSNGTLIGYYGRSRSLSDHSRSSNFLMLTQRRERVILNEEEFLYISQLINHIVIINYCNNYNNCN